jgi:hypothetical protein
MASSRVMEPLLGRLPPQVFRGDLTLGIGSLLRGLFTCRVTGAAAFMPTKRRTVEIARSRSLAVQSALVRSREVPAASPISTTYRLAEGLRGGMLPVHASS